jgi:hypothetical protein
MQKRSCHDILFLVLFIAFWAGMFYIAGKAVQNGNPKRYLYGVDYYGNICGENNIANGQVPADKAFDFTNDKYLYFMPSTTVYKGYIDICIAKCPSVTNTSQLYCPYNTNSTDEELPPLGQCYPAYESSSLLHRCIPALQEVENTTINVIKDLNVELAASVSLKVFGTLARSWQYIAVSAAGSLVLAFVWLLLLSRFAGVIVYLTIIAVHIVMAVLAYLVYHEMQLLQTDWSDTPEYLRLTDQQDTIDALKGVFITLVVILVLIFFGVLCLWNRIGIAIGIIKEASIAMIHIPTILLVPIGVGAAIVPLAVYWFYIGAYLATTGSPEYDADGNFVKYQTQDVWVRLLIYHLLGGYWALNFLHAVGECTIAGAIASWYWVHDKKDVPKAPVASSLYRVFRYHLGSLMFGSLILAIV